MSLMLVSFSLHDRCDVNDALSNPNDKIMHVTTRQSNPNQANQVKLILERVSTTEYSRFR